MGDGGDCTAFSGPQFKISGILPGELTLDAAEALGHPEFVMIGLYRIA